NDVVAVNIKAGHPVIDLLHGCLLPDDDDCRPAGEGPWCNRIWGSCSQRQSEVPRPCTRLVAGSTASTIDTATAPGASGRAFHRPGVEPRPMPPCRSSRPRPFSRLACARPPTAPAPPEAAPDPDPVPGPPQPTRTAPPHPPRDQPDPPRPVLPPPRLPHCSRLRDRHLAEVAMHIQPDEPHR